MSYSRIVSMSDHFALTTPVAFFIFNRPDATERVFAEIARAKPRRLLVVADGPRSTSEAERCFAARAVIEQVDWDCEVLTNFSEVNLGCKRRVASGLDWVFDHCDEAIILEDDCLPHPTLFRYCAELLEKYRGDERVMMISGDSFLGERDTNGYSYYFGYCFHIWGWATWRRAWRHYDVDMKLWPELKETAWLSDILVREDLVNYWRNIFDKVFAGGFDTWDYQWFYTCWSQHGLAIIPNVNLVRNIGFGEMATHTRDFVSTMADIPAAEIPFPLRHPQGMLRDREADILTVTRIWPWVVERRGLYHILRRKWFCALPIPVQRSFIFLRAKLTAQTRRHSLSS